MELHIAGGVGEHGRNCFHVRGRNICFLVDCGIMAADHEDPYPHLTLDKIRSLNFVFLTHSHADHTGALGWLKDNGFTGKIITSVETLRQLKLDECNTNIIRLEELCPDGNGSINANTAENTEGDIPAAENSNDRLDIIWGRSGHCAGSVWYEFTECGRTIFFSGDYTEDTFVYECDRIRGRRADLAVIDCAYGSKGLGYEEACSKLIAETCDMLCRYGTLLFPVPRYGRGLELIKLLSDHLPGSDKSNNSCSPKSIKYVCDEIFMKNLKNLENGGVWYKDIHLQADFSLCSRRINYQSALYDKSSKCCQQTYTIIFLSDPQLKTESARVAAESVVSQGGRVILTGTVERGSYSSMLLNSNAAKCLFYPVHLNRSGFESICAENDFTNVIPYHSSEYTADEWIEI